jgi:hypothetical protein
VDRPQLENTPLLEARAEEQRGSQVASISAALLSYAFRLASFRGQQFSKALLHTQLQM